MDTLSRHQHWENIYKTSRPDELSWFQAVPATSLDFVKKFHLPANARIIDIGGGDSRFADALLDLGYRDITVLDISETAIEKAKQRLGKKAEDVKWIVADATTFQPAEKYDFWHDRATFHFLTEEKEIDRYIDTIRENINPEGVLVIGTFSNKGPKKCSGYEIKQYSETTMTERLKKFFKKIRCIRVDHQTPFNTIQNFIFCSFKKIPTSAIARKASARYAS